MRAFSAGLEAYRAYREVTRRSRVYKVVRYLVASAILVYIFLLSFPQPIFAYETSDNGFTIYSREPLDSNIHTVLATVDAKLLASGLADKTVKPRIFISNSHGLYKFLSLYVGGSSFGKAYPLLPTTNIFINKSDVTRDLVFRDAGAYRERSLSGVIAHEVTHLLVRKKYGYIKNLMLPTWKKEGYSEYVAGGSLLDYETGVRFWKTNPANDSGYRYFKYYLLVKHLIEVKKVSVEELFTQDFDTQSLEQEVLSTL